MNYYIYIHRRKTDNSVFYIGIGNKKRPYDKCNRNPHWHNINNKHGLIVEIISDDVTKNEACEIEKFIIKNYGIENLSNMTEGGDGFIGFKLSDESRLKMSIAKKGAPLSEEHKKNVSIANKGKVRSKESLKNMSEAQKGRPQKKIKCPYCGKIGGTVMCRYHFNKCSLKEFNKIEL